jgi:hypothetical protein
VGRTRSGDSLIDDAYRRSDNEGATDRHPRTDVLRYVNQGGAELWDLLIEARGPDYFRANPAALLTTLASTTSYDLPGAFYLLISVRLNGDYGDALVPFTAQEEPYLRAPLTSQALPYNYQLRRKADGTNYLEVLPVHTAGETITVEYVPIFTDLTDSPASVFNGVNGWEEYIVLFAARCMAVKDEEWQLAQALDTDMGRMRARILKLAPKRDMHRAKRVTDVRNGRLMARRWW